ncbi:MULTISPECIES: cell division site-positioning protein MapZ family protein [Vagococcus]|uniref:Zinc ribbon domain-containing protein n=1 Tax=Vagococcus fluvialis bH819 TaxID=1255619 RepID=A0A1X6WNG2_9ENTE|nr:MULTISPECIES: cell division site-positioning protein MapZ family protein [Vagococcus]SLM85815.1 hypothetical protein FM121_06920 [Vagococcus fluvialis bH819]HCM90237.1 zinc ribbon domain-containing protein [Vagococcus sp.]
MTNEIKKCPNCGHQFKSGEEYCPNCDLFIPMNEQNENDATFDPEKTQTFKTFKETENKSDENFSEPTFKHRGKTSVDNTSDTIEEAETISNQSEEKKEPETEKNQPISNENISSEDTTEIEETFIDKEESLDIHSEDPLEVNNEPINEIEVVVSDDKESVEVKSNKEQPSSNKKKTKAIIGLSATVVLIVGGLTFYSTQQKKNEEKATTELVSTTELNLNSLYSSSEHIYLKKNVTQDDIKKAKESLEKLKGKEDYADLKKEFDTVEEKFNKQNAINEVFKKPIIDSDQLDTKVYVKNADKLSMNKIATEKDGFDILYNKAFSEAEEQKSSLTKANDSLSIVYKEDQVVKEASKEQYDDAEKAIKAIKDPGVKKEFSEKLDKVKAFLDEKEKEKQAEAEAFAAEQAKIAQQEQQIQANPNNNNNNNSSGTFKATDPNYKWGNRKDGNINNNDDAWAWNPGIQEKVISEVISRGYVAEGGYYLEPVYIENGEGFYNLYATTNSKIFPKSKAEEFPLYVVTINAKTGWFKGNGPN